MNFLSRMSARDRRAVVIGCCVLLGLLLVRFALMPLLESWGQTRDRIASSDSRLRQLQAKTTRYLLARERLLENYGPGAAKPLEEVQAAQINLVQAISDALKAGGLSLQGLQPQGQKPVKELPGAVQVSFQVKTSGQLAQLARSLEAMRKAPTLIIAEQVSAAGNDKTPGQLELTLVLSTLASDPKYAISRLGAAR